MYTTEYYSAIKRSESLIRIHAETQMNPKNMTSEKSQTERVTIV